MPTPPPLPTSELTALSPLSDDSLSSAGASTEPLPASDHLEDVSSPGSRGLTARQLAGGFESDSSLTEQSDSEGEQGARGRKGSKSKGKKGGKGRKKNARDENESREDGGITPRGERNGSGRSESEDGVRADLRGYTSSEGEDGKFDNQTELEEDIESGEEFLENNDITPRKLQSKTASPPSNSRLNSLSPLLSLSPSLHSADEEDDEDEAGDNAAYTKEPARRGGRGGARGVRGGRGRGRGRGRGSFWGATASSITSNQQRERSVSSSRSLSSVDDGSPPALGVEESIEPVKQHAATNGGPPASASKRGRGRGRWAGHKRGGGVVRKNGPPPALTSTSGSRSTSAELYGRSDNEALPLQNPSTSTFPVSGASPSESSTSRAQSSSSNIKKRPRSDSQDTTSALDTLADLSTPAVTSGANQTLISPESNGLLKLVEKLDNERIRATSEGEESENEVEVEAQVIELELAQERDLRAEELDGEVEHGEVEGDGEEEGEIERELETVDMSSGSGKRKVGKADKRKKGNKKKAVERGDEDMDEEEEYIGSDVEEDTSDDVSLRKRAEAMEALTRIEIEFARLRDRLYMERMADIEKERSGVESGTHPDLLHLTQLIELRRARKLDLARKWLEGSEGAFERHRDSDEHTAWTTWADERSELRTTMLDEANSKRRKLDREKRVIDRPKNGGLSPLLAPRPLPSIPMQHRRRIGFEVEVVIGDESASSMRHADLRMDASVAGLDEEDAQTDLERMGLREPVRQTSQYPFDSSFGHTLNNTGFGNLRMAPNHLAMPFGYPSYEAPHFLPSLPPLPSTLPSRMDYNHGTSRPLSNPRANTYSKDSPATPIHRNSPTARGYPSTQFASASAFDQEVDRMQGQWPKVASQQSMPSPYQYDELRRTASGVQGSSDSMDTSADHQSRQLEEIPVSAIKENSSGTNASRFTLDAHMARSPKASPKVPASVNKVEATRNSPSFMSIPAFVPHHSQLPHQHSQSVAQPAVLPPLPSLPTVLAPSPSISSPSLSHLPSLPNLPALPQVASAIPSPPNTAATAVVDPRESTAAAEIQDSSVLYELPTTKGTAPIFGEHLPVATAYSISSSTAELLPPLSPLIPLANGIIPPSILAIPSPPVPTNVEGPPGQALFPYYPQAIPERPAPPPAISAQSSTG